jgi:ABC-type oligopeptide transport system ATPase subunit
MNKEKIEQIEDADEIYTNPKTAYMKKLIAAIPLKEQGYFLLLFIEKYPNIININNVAIKVYNSVAILKIHKYGVENKPNINIKSIICILSFGVKFLGLIT